MSALSASQPQSAWRVPQWETSATVCSGRAARSWRRYTRLASSSVGSSGDPDRALGMPVTSSPPGKPSSSSCSSSGELRMLFSSASHQRSLAGRQSSIGTERSSHSWPKAIQAVCTARLSGERRTTSTLKEATTGCHDCACARPVLVRSGSGRSFSVMFPLLSPWRTRMMRFGRGEASVLAEGVDWKLSDTGVDLVFVRG
mmetsp:Transcript_31767/g.72269  ORF Transcript_31767/g.72269 Transcript_31767/m.72269 type:complete len:200 (+) Transcript_31767:176-775(+)